MNKRESGALGEDIAVEFLQKKGYRIIERNFLTPIGEIDIIAKKDGILCFVEVKFRKSDSFGSAFEAVDYRKLNKLRKVIEFYCLKNKIKDTPLRVEVIGITEEMGSYNIKHLENVFY